MLYGKKMRATNGYGKVVNCSYMKVKKQNGAIEGDQSLNNPQTYIVVYDEETNDFIGRWIGTPDFAKRTVGRCTEL